MRKPLDEQAWGVGERDLDVFWRGRQEFLSGPFPSSGCSRNVGEQD